MSDGTEEQLKKIGAVLDSEREEMRREYLERVAMEMSERKLRIEVLSLERSAHMKNAEWQASHEEREKEHRRRLLINSAMNSLIFAHPDWDPEQVANKSIEYAAAVMRKAGE